MVGAGCDRGVIMDIVEVTVEERRFQRRVKRQQEIGALAPVFDDQETGTAPAQAES